MRLFLLLILFLLIFAPVQAEPTRTYTGNKANTNLSGEVEQPDIASIKFSPDGTKVFVSDHDNTNVNDGVHQYTLSTPWDISTLDASTRISVDINTGDNHDRNSKKPILFNGDGTKFFIFGTFSGTLSVYNLTSPYDISSVSASTQVADDGIAYNALDLGSDPVNGETIRLHDADFNNDGTKMYLLDGDKGSTSIVEYNLSTPFDPSSASYNTTLDTEPDGVNEFGMELAFDDDGTRMYFNEGNNGKSTNYKMFVYKLSTPFSIASATFVGTHTLNLESASDGGTMFTWAFGGYNGKKLYLTTNEDSTLGFDDYIYEFDLSCPYGIVICENEIATVIGGQVEIAKNVIYQNSNTIFKRFDWLRRNEEKTNLNSHNIKLKINNHMYQDLYIDNISDMYSNQILDTINIQNKFISDDGVVQGGNIYGSVTYSGSYPVIVKAESSDLESIYHTYVDSMQNFSFFNIKPGFYTFSSYEVLDNYDSTYYYNGRWGPFKRAAKFGIYPDLLEVRNHWDIKDMVILVK